MLSLMCHHGKIDLKIKAIGDTEVDYHHLMEDVGIGIGNALIKAVGDKKGIRRYGFAKIPMDESLAEVVVDLSGRPFFVYNVSRKRGKLKDLPVSLFEEFFRALLTHAMMNLHITVNYGRDLHHIYEAIFKAFGRALKEAVTVESKVIPSTKGKL
jgi:imidazoleglycerol-phosphate dehydratase